jgi:heterodisulfide reductase subunit B
MKIAYYPGCTLKETARNFNDSAVESAKILGIEMVELPRWNCCGAVFSLTSDDLMHHLGAIRNLIRVKEMSEEGLIEDDHRLLTLCSMCYGVLKRANLLVKENAEHLKKINDFMYLEKDYDGGVEVTHLLTVLKDIGFETVKEKTVNPLKDLRIAAYYGCTLLRPKEVAVDDPESPHILEDLLASLGAEAIDSAYKTRCCGSYQTVRDKYAVAEIAYDILSRTQREGAEAITTSCPLCAFNLDERQKEIVEKHPDFQAMPVFYFTQLMAVAFGLDEKCSAFDLNSVDPRPVLEQKSLLHASV